LIKPGSPPNSLPNIFFSKYFISIIVVVFATTDFEENMFGLELNYDCWYSYYYGKKKKNNLFEKMLR
jgi:hypothetical protein